MNMFGRTKPIRAIPLTPTPKLPTNFAERLLELETQLSYNLSINLISSLMELYSCAIEYYESMQDKKYLHYKDRLQSLLSKKEVLEILSSSVPNTEKKVQNEVFKNRHSETRLLEERKNKVVIKRPQSSNFTTSQPMQKKDADVAINEHLHESSTASSLVKASIRSQEGDNLQQRLQARKRASSLKPQKTVEKGEKEGMRSSKLEMYQREIEDIMEKYAEEKVMRVQNIEKKFMSAGSGSEDLEKMKKKEIEEAQLEIIRERKEKIMMLRNKYET